MTVKEIEAALKVALAKNDADIAGLAEQIVRLRLRRSDLIEEARTAQRRAMEPTLSASEMQTITVEAWVEVVRNAWAHTDECCGRLYALAQLASTHNRTDCVESVAEWLRAQVWASPGSDKDAPAITLLSLVRAGIVRDGSRWWAKMAAAFPTGLAGHPRVHRELMYTTFFPATETP